ncbi:MAG: class C beta-lactamase-related serine hydrolase, partial [Variovorax sp.]
MKTIRPERVGTTRHLLLAALLWLGAAGVAAAEAVVPAETWATPSPEVPSRWSSEKLKAADAFAESLRTDAYLVIDHGVLVHSYGDIDKPMNLASIRKSVLGVLTGMQVDRGTIDLDQTLADLDIDDKEGLTPTERSATVRQLLQSRSGVYHPAAYETQDA